MTHVEFCLQSLPTILFFGLPCAALWGPKPKTCWPRRGTALEIASSSKRCTVAIMLQPHPTPSPWFLVGNGGMGCRDYYNTRDYHRDPFPHSLLRAREPSNTATELSLAAEACTPKALAARRRKTPNSNTLGPIDPKPLNPKPQTPYANPHP